MKKLLIPIFLLLAAFPAQASTGTQFTVYGQVFNTDGTPVNGVTVYLTASGSTISANTTTAERTNGSLVNGYYSLDLANLPAAVGEGTSMTLSASYSGASVSTTVARNATEPQKVNLYLSTGSSGSSGGGSSSGGGGGGGGTSAEDYTNIQVKESREEFMVKDLPTSYKFATPEFPVSEIVITSSINAGMINVQVELLKNISSLVKMSASGTVYKYTNIWVGTSGFAVPNNLKEAVIKFKVENSWLTSGSFKDADIIMLRWDGTQWVQLETRPKNKDSSFTYYEAKTNAFSPFVITALKSAAVPATTSGAEAKASVQPTETASSAPVPSKEASVAQVILVIIIAIAMISAIYVLKLRRR